METQAGTIRSFFLEGPAGRLEALLNAGVPAAAYCAVVCHPHPVYGGTLHNKVVFHAMKALNSFGFPVLRFNFRGTGLSQASMTTEAARWKTCRRRWIGWTMSFTCLSSSLDSPSARRSACARLAPMRG